MMHARIPLDERTRLVSYLPLSHIAAMGIDVYSAIYCGSFCGVPSHAVAATVASIAPRRWRRHPRRRHRVSHAGAHVHFADAMALKGSLKTTLLQCRPTLFFGVPRVWEKMAAAMQCEAAW